MTTPEAHSCAQSLALQRDLDAARARVLELEGERDEASRAAAHYASEVAKLCHVRTVAQETCRRAIEARDAARAEVASLRGALADTPENVEALTPGLASAAAYGELRVYDGNRHSIARGILGILRGRLPVTPGGDR